MKWNFQSVRTIPSSTSCSISSDVVFLNNCGFTIHNIIRISNTTAMVLAIDKNTIVPVVKPPYIIYWSFLI